MVSILLDRHGGLQLYRWHLFRIQYSLTPKSFYPQGKILGKKL